MSAEAQKQHNAKIRFIHMMGPYYLQAVKEKQTDEFFQEVFRQYCDRWPDLARYTDWDYRAHVHDARQKV